ncbi:MFS transporter [Streptomyces sp. NBC_01808]|uniref:MFS transporter n=1 Tax=Streptomyces sp. NBC_01808 TaxID=2975947 RepID=UPI003FA3A4B1
MTADTGWSPTATTAAFSAALLVSALAGIPLGRVLDRRGPRAVMTAGSALGVTAGAALAAAPNQAVFTAAWLLAGITMAATFYQPAFAAVTRWWGEDRVRALTIVTLAGGLSSTVFAPLTAALASHFSWRVTYAVLAAVLAVVTLPAHALARRAPWPPAPPPPPRSAGGGRSVARTRPFVTLAAALMLNSFAMYAVVIALVPLLTERRTAHRPLDPPTRPGPYRATGNDEAPQRHAAAGPRLAAGRDASRSGRIRRVSPIVLPRVEQVAGALLRCRPQLLYKT